MIPQVGDMYMIVRTHMGNPSIYVVIGVDQDMYGNCNKGYVRHFHIFGEKASWGGNNYSYATTSDYTNDHCVFKKLTLDNLPDVW